MNNGRTPIKAYGCSTYFWGPGNQALNPLSPKTPLTLIFCLSWRRTQSISKCILRGLASGGISQLEKKYITFLFNRRSCWRPGLNSRLRESRGKGPGLQVRCDELSSWRSMNSKFDSCGKSLLRATVRLGQEYMQGCHFQNWRHGTTLAGGMARS